MKSMMVYPVPDRRIRMPERNFDPVPDGGALVPDNIYYHKAILDGDITTTAPSSTSPVSQDVHSGDDADHTTEN